MSVLSTIFKATVSALIVQHFSYYDCGALGNCQCIEAGRNLLPLGYVWGSHPNLARLRRTIHLSIILTRRFSTDL